MSIFTSAKAKLAAQKLAEEQLYEFAAEEIAANNIRPGLWAKALAEAEGDDSKAKARYIKLRVETMRAEADLSNFAQEETRRSASGNAGAQSAKAEKERAQQRRKTREHSEAFNGSTDDVIFVIACGCGFIFLLLLAGAVAQ